MAEWALTSQLNPWMVLVAILVMFIIMGCFMESMSMILVVIPFIWPVLVSINGGEHVLAAQAAFGMNLDDLKIWFGILALVVVELGLITPPVGLNVFIISKVSNNVPMGETFKGVMPFFGSELVRVAIIVAFPTLTLLVPHMMAK